MAMDKRILAIAFEGTVPAQCVALYSGNELLVKELVEITVEPYAWMQIMLRDVEEKTRKGWVVMLEDRTASFSRHATSWNFDAVGADGRTNLQTCLDWYFMLQRRGQIFMGSELQRYEMRIGGEMDMIDAKNDDKGRLIYNINWRLFSSAHRALLMCVAGAVMEEQLSDRWIESFVGNLPEVKKPPVWPVFRVMKDLWKKQQLDFEAKVDAMEARKHV